jgi:N-acetylneuraminic acid mutarotase
MPTKRASATAICTESSLIVVGGVGHGLSQCPVEVMSIEDHQWSIAAGINIQGGIQGASGVICGDQLYILGATDSKSVYSCKLGDLLQSCRSANSAPKLATPRDSSYSNIWRKLADLPTYNSTCVSLCGHLVAIGGNVPKTTYEPPTKTVYTYNRTTNSWEVISEMSVARRKCFVAALPATNELMVVGGTSGFLDHIIDYVEFASVILM